MMVVRPWMQGSEWANGKVPEHVETALANLEDPEVGRLGFLGGLQGRTTHA